MRTRTLWLATAAVLALALGACGDDDSDDNGNGGSGGDGGGEQSSAYGGGGGGGGGDSGGGGTTLKLSADPGGAPKFDKTSLSATPGKVTVDFDNPSDVPHAVEIEGNGVEEETETLTGGRAKPLTVELKKGEYEFYCPVGNHEAEGMKGTLEVG